MSRRTNSTPIPRGGKRPGKDAPSSFVGSGAGSHDNVPGSPSAKVEPVWCQLATMALKSKTVTTPKGGLHGRSCHRIWDVSASGLSCTRLAAFCHLGSQSAGDVVVQPGPALDHHHRHVFSSWVSRILIKRKSLIKSPWSIETSD